MRPGCLCRLLLCYLGGKKDNTFVQVIIINEHAYIFTSLKYVSWYWNWHFYDLMCLFHIISNSYSLVFLSSSPLLLITLETTSNLWIEEKSTRFISHLLYLANFTMFFFFCLRQIFLFPLRGNDIFTCSHLKF